MINKYVYILLATFLFIISCSKENNKKTYSDSENKGYQLYIKHACNTCHSLDGSRMNGPTFKDSYGKLVYLYNDKTAIVNDEYLINSIINPSKDIVEGYPNLMPKYDLNRSEIDILIDFIKKQ